MSTITSSLYTLFGSKTRVDLLAQLITHPSESFYIRQLAALIHQSAATVLRELIKLEEMGMVVCERRANAKYYAIDTHCPLYPELQSIILKTVGVGDVVREHLGSIEMLSYAFIYGSFASGEVTPTSDLDLMLIGKAPLARLTKAVRAIESRLNREVQYSLFDRKEFLQKIRKKNEFILQVLESPKIMLIGDDDEFRRLTTKGTD